LPLYFKLNWKLHKYLLFPKVRFGISYNGLRIKEVAEGNLGEGA